MKAEVVEGAKAGVVLSDSLKQDMNDTARKDFNELHDAMGKELETVTKQMKGRTQILKNGFEGKVRKVRQKAELLDSAVEREKTANVEVRTKLTEQIVKSASAIKEFDDKLRDYPEKFMVESHPKRQGMLSIDDSIRNERMKMEDTAGQRLDKLYVSVRSIWFHWNRNDFKIC